MWKMKQIIDDLEIHPLTPERWDDLEALFGERGACAGCWCMWWRLTPKDYKQNAGAENRAALKALVDSGAPTGLLAYSDGPPAGWCSVAPREQLLRVPRSTTWRPIDDQPVWSISCFFVDRARRGQKIAVRLLRAAIQYAAKNGAQVIEAYPKDIGEDKAAPASIYFGTVAMYRDAGFVEVARRRPEFPIMRLTVE
jgi:GNAT superfamily N-acetyltransferase